VLRSFYLVLLVAYSVIVLAVSYEAITGNDYRALNHTLVFCSNWPLGFLSGLGFAGLVRLCWARPPRDERRTIFARKIYFN
jgi:hypothetical protein